jgi:hypothetical protein
MRVELGCHGHFLCRTRLSDQSNPKNCEYGRFSKTHAVAPAVL